MLRGQVGGGSSLPAPSPSTAPPAIVRFRGMHHRWIPSVGPYDGRQRPRCTQRQFDIGAGSDSITSGGVIQRSADSPGVAVFPPLLFGGALALGLLLQWIWPAHPLPSLPARLVGVVLLAASGLLARSAEAAMKRAGTNIRPDQPTLAVVSDGPFRFTRNPLYLALTGLYVGITLLADSLWPLLLLVPVLVVLQWGVVAREERYLEAKFGEPYRAYKARVRRWV
jgi:protein-S-isoprenylcysteine O-methyltransferase Ste14